MITIVSYAIYAFLSISITIWVAKTLHTNGRAFLIDAFKNNSALADSVNHLLVVGFYLVNLGYMSWVLKLSERPDEIDQAWYAVLAPYPDPEIAVVVTVEQGGFGADTAAPVALQILQAYFDKQAHAVSGGVGSVE